MAGVWVEEIDALAPEQTNTVTFHDGSTVSCNLLCDLMHPEGAACLAACGGNFYAGMPAVTRNQFGKGFAYYLGTNMNREDITKVLSEVILRAHVKPVIDEETELEVTCRKADNCIHYYIFHFQDREIPIPEQFVDR